MNSKARILALYLPQYHPFPENDEWWGKGFTEWTNVGRGVPLFKGHYQPKIPSELGYYDLRLPIVREQQVELAKEAGIEGFCYWHYWFGNGKQLMADIFDEVLKSGAPDFPFCLGWANHSWYSKNWNIKDSTKKDKLLIEQTYPGDEDIRMHYEYALKAFKDRRYIKEGNKPVFMIFKCDSIPNNFIDLWSKWAIEDGFDGIFFIGNIAPDQRAEPFISKGFSAVIRNRPNTIMYNRNRNRLKLFWATMKSNFLKRPKYLFEYKDAMRSFLDIEEDSKEYFIPNLIPNFDHSPRSGVYGFILNNSTPELFYQHAKDVLSLVNKKQNKFVMLRSWNEWGEGNYMEPDIKYGKGYINALRKAIEETTKK